MRRGHRLAMEFLRKVGHTVMDKSISASLIGFGAAVREHMKYEGWNFNFVNAAVTFDTAHLQSSYFHRPSMYSPKLCRTRSQR